MGITDIDPIKYNLIFERFLNPERISMPDFDIDFCYERRQEVIEYVCRKYGNDHVAQIITFGTMSAKMVIRDVGRVLNVPYSETDKLAKMIPNELHITIKKALEMNREFKNLYDTDEKTRKLIDIAMRLEGLPRHSSTHAAGVVITKDPVVSYVPLYVNDNQVSTQYTMTILEELGLLKMDFLGLRTLTVIDDAIKLVKRDRNIDIDFGNLDDQNVFRLWHTGQTVGIFQFESQGMTNFMKELKPDTIEDIIAGVSLYRPGPMDQIPRYIANKQNPNNIQYTHKALEPILKVTYGCMVYQEQVMQIVRDLAGYSLGRADLVRRAMGKKKLDVMAKEREYFVNGQVDENGNVIIKGCVANGIDVNSANKIFDEMAEFAKYAFNKSHAAAYSVVSYRTAYLKTYFPEEFMAAMLNSFLGNLDKIPVYVDECKRLNIDILKPNINKSFTKFIVEKKNKNIENCENLHKDKENLQVTKNNLAIRFGLGSIKNVGIKAVQQLINEREKNGEYKSFEDFAERIQGENINKKCIESLIKAGVFDELGKNRATLLASYENILDTISGSSRRNMKGQVTLFDLQNLTTSTTKQLENNKYQYEEKEELPKKTLLNQEREMTGIYLSGHPLDNYRDIILKEATVTSHDIREYIQDMAENNITNDTRVQDGKTVKIVGVINSIKKLYTKRNTEMAFITVEDLFGNIEIVVFDRVYEKFKKQLVESNVVIIEGNISVKDEENVNIICNNVSNIENDKYFGKIFEIDISNLSRNEKDNLKVLIRTFNNKKNNVKIQVNDNGKIIPCGNMYLDDMVIKAFKEKIGNEVFKFKII